MTGPGAVRDLAPDCQHTPCLAVSSSDQLLSGLLAGRLSALRAGKLACSRNHASHQVCSMRSSSLKDGTALFRQTLRLPHSRLR